MVEDADVEEALRSGGWKAMTDPGTGKTYYYNKALGKTTWNLKKELAKAAGGAKAEPAKATAKAASGKAAATPTSNAETEEATSGTKKPKKRESVKEEHASSSETKREESATEELEPEREKQDSTTSPAEVEAVPMKPKTVDAKDTDRSELALLKQENQRLQQLVASGSQGVIAHELMSATDTLKRSTTSLQVELERTQQEKRSLEDALLAASTRIQEQQQTIAKYESMIDPHVESEAQSLATTLSHLREQNAHLVRQVSELSVLLARGLHEQASIVDKWVAEVSVETGLQLRRCQKSDATGDASHGVSLPLLRRILESSARNLLCTACLRNVERAKESTELSIPDRATQVGAAEDGTLPGAALRSSHTAALVGSGMPSYAVYDPVASLQSPYAGHLLHTSPQRVVPQHGSLGGGSRATAVPDAFLKPPQTVQPVPQQNPRPVYYEGYLVHHPSRKL